MSAHEAGVAIDLESDAAERLRSGLEIAAGVALLASGRASRLAGLLYGAALSRAHGRARDRLAGRMLAAWEDLFAQRTSVGARVDLLEDRAEVLEIIALACSPAAHKAARRRIVADRRQRSGQVAP